MRRSALMSVAAALAALLAAGSAAAQQSFYRDNKITVLVGGTAGGGFDIFSRTMASHLGRFIPGNPGIIVQDMPGGGGIVVTNHIYNTAPKDGTVIAYVGPTAVQPLLSPGDAKIRFDSQKITWVGSLSSTHSVLFAFHTTPFKSAEDLVTRQMIVAGTGAASTTDTYPKILNEILGTKFKLITGYQGSKETMIAIERGEADGRFMSIDSLQSTSPGWLRDGWARVILQAAVTRLPEFPDVPTARDLAKTEQQRQAVDFAFMQDEMGRPIAAPPGIPPERAKILRDAFAQMTKDQKFLAEAKAHGLEVAGPLTGAEVDAMVKKIYATPQAVVDRVAAAMN
jgi:tripartite-type tricarboxylate transporter receptor subunit TctC